MNSIYSQPAWRLAALGLVVSAAGALGIVSMASAHDSSVPGTQPIVGRAPMGPMGAISSSPSPKKAKSPSA